mmetsp:Transcript_41421/g.129098  ORF Transcript_41421/g.129098 Transcript_41421/m.129098 type:complete len:256 (+) Transcript_41421:323-1090(+)
MVALLRGPDRVVLFHGLAHAGGRLRQPALQCPEGVSHDTVLGAVAFTRNLKLLELILQGLHVGSDLLQELGAGLAVQEGRLQLLLLHLRQDGELEERALLAAVLLPPHPHLPHDRLRLGPALLPQGADLRFHTCHLREGRVCSGLRFAPSGSELLADGGQAGAQELPNALVALDQCLLEVLLGDDRKLCRVPVLASCPATEFCNLCLVAHAPGERRHGGPHALRGRHEAALRCDHRPREAGHRRHLSSSLCSRQA